MYKLKVGSRGSKRYSNLGSRLSRIWQKRQITVNCGKLQSHTQSLLAKSVETGSGVL